MRFFKKPETLAFCPDIFTPIIVRCPSLYSAEQLTNVAPIFEALSEAAHLLINPPPHKHLLYNKHNNP